MNNSIHEKAKIYKNTEIKNSTIFEGSIIGDESIILDSKIKSNVSINRRNYILRSEVGKYSYTGIGTMIRSARVGSFCSLSWNISIGGGNHEYQHVTTSPLWRFDMMNSEGISHNKNKELQKRFQEQPPCIIGNDVWIATNVVVLRDVKIGDGAVIGAGAIVTEDVEPYSIVVGMPAKTIKKRFDEKTIDLFEEIRWWDWSDDIIRENRELIYKSNVNDEVKDKLLQISEINNSEN